VAVACASTQLPTLGSSGSAGECTPPWFYERCASAKVGSVCEALAGLNQSVAPTAVLKLRFSPDARNAGCPRLSAWIVCPGSNSHTAAHHAPHTRRKPPRISYVPVICYVLHEVMADAFVTTPDLNGANVLVSGGAGFIGSHIVDQVLAAGAARVVILDQLDRGRRDNLSGALAGGKVELTVGDIRDAALVDRLVVGVDIVCHQAALRITQCAEEPVRAIEVMIGGTQNVLEAAVKHGVRKVVAASSASVYGEASYVPMDEMHPFNNRTLYGCAKIANEQLLRAYAEMYGLQYVALRPFNVYGPRMDMAGVYTEVMIRWLDRLARHEAPIIFGDGTQTMDFVHVEDVARAYVLAMDGTVTDEVFNVGTGTETSLLELCRLLCDATGQPDVEPIFMPARKVNPVTRRMAAVERARSGLCFEARIRLREGLHDLIRWHSMNLKLLQTRVNP
jgi:UDP-glucose 4-epimerase